MADKSINQLPVSDGLTDDGLLVVYQDKKTKSISGNLIKQFAQQGIEAALADAKASGEFDGADGYTPVKGIDYFDGEDGEDAVSPTIAVSDVTGGHKLTITDKNGTRTVDVMDGTDGYTPVKGKDYFDGEDGEDGYTPQKDVDYFDGEDGKDGVSPTITVQAITGGHRITITDATGTNTVDVMDGTGAGDMTATVYDPQGKAQDVFAYADAVQGNLNTHDGNTTKHITAAERTAWYGKADKAIAFTVTLLAANWVNNNQTITSDFFLADGYVYIVTPSSDSFRAYGEAGIYAQDITTNGSCTFVCDTDPAEDLTVNVLRTEVVT